MTRHRARYLAVEGIDGAGKSTFTRLLADRLRRKGFQVRVRREPHDPGLGGYAQRVGPRDPWAAAVFFTLDRYLTREGLERDLAEADFVLTDRSFWSTIAYQGSALPPRDRARLEGMQRAATLPPDRVLLLDLGGRRALGRLGRRGRSRAPFERQATLDRVARAYRSLARSPRWLLLDARAPSTELVEEAISRLKVGRPKPRRRRSP